MSAPDPLTILAGGLVSGLALGWLTAIPWLDRKDTPRPPRYTTTPRETR